MDQILGLIGGGHSTTTTEDDGFAIDQGWRPTRESEYEPLAAKAALFEGGTVNQLPSPPQSRPQQKMLFRAEIRQLARIEFQEALRELEETREKRARKLVEEATRRAADRGGGPLPRFAKMVDVSSSYCASFQRYVKRMCTRYNSMRYIPRVEDRYVYSSIPSSVS